jgi:anaphase-promoting complex subunit 3
MAQNANNKPFLALETLAEAFRLDPRNPQARFQRATIYSAMNRPEDALAELEIVRDAAPQEATVWFAMGKILKKLNRPEQAMRCFLTAMDLDPKDSQLIKSAMDKLDEPDIDDESTNNF